MFALRSRKDARRVGKLHLPPGAVYFGSREAYGLTYHLAKRLHRASPKTGERRSLRKIANMLADAGHVNQRGETYNQGAIKHMVDGPRP